MDLRSPKHLLGVIAVLVGVAVLGSPAHATLPGQNGEIGFAHSGPPTEGVYARNVFTINQDGTGLHNFTNLHANSFEPVWSPDGQWLAFRSDYEPALGVGADNYYNLFAVDANGRTLIQLTNLEEGGIDPTWSPRGDAIAYFSDQHVYRVTDGTGPQLLAPGRSPEWSPDGSRIAFGGIEGGIYTMRPDGTDQRLLTSTTAMSVQWSPDSSMLAFDAIRPGPIALPYGSFSVGVIDADGTDERIVSQTPEGALWPDWSPDGRRITYGGSAGGNLDIYVVNAGGGGGTRLTREPDFQRAPVWSPDGRMIAFLGGGVVDGVTVMKADGTGQRFLTEGHGELSWQSIPDQRRCKALWKRGGELASCIRRAHRGR